jgi:hypothetical protein
MQGENSNMRLQFVLRTLFWCGAVAPRVTAALLGRFLPRLGPLATASGPFFCFNNAVDFPTQGANQSKFYNFAINKLHADS